MKIVFENTVKLMRKVISSIVKMLKPLKPMKAARSKVTIMIEQIKQVKHTKQIVLFDISTMYMSVMDQIKALLSRLRFTTLVLLALSFVTVSSTLLIVSLPVQTCYAGKFSSTYSCQDNGKRCVSSGARTVDGYLVHRDCWEWSYNKTCSYPSKNDCSKYAHCYMVAIRDCLFKDSIGNCVNQLKEFSCKRWEPTIKESREVKVDFEEREGEDGLVCAGIPCLDGNCVDKSYLTNGEMMDSVSKLYVVSEGKVDGDMNFEIFKGDGWHCSKKMAQYTNCCSTKMSGWGTNLGAGCTKDERTLLENRQKNLCTYVGKEEKTTIGVTTVVKHHWCCFDNIISKVVQEQGREQLGLTFGTADAPNCRGLTLDELERIDFQKLDLSEFIKDFKAKFFGKYKAPNIADMETRVKGTMPDIRKFDGDPHNQDNNMTGWSERVKDDSYEATEEKLFEEEHLRLVQAERESKKAEDARLIEEQRQLELRRQTEQTRLAEIRTKEEKARRKISKEQELARAEQECRDASTKWNRWSNSNKHIPSNNPERIRQNSICQNTYREVKRLKEELKSGNY